MEELKVGTVVQIVDKVMPRESSYLASLKNYTKDGMETSGQ